MIIVSGTFDLADTSAVDKVTQATVPFQLAARDGEPGCHAYVVSADPSVPGRIQLYELWEDDAALAAHFQHDNYTGVLQALEGLELTGSTVVKYTVTEAVPLFDESQ